MKKLNPEDAFPKHLSDELDGTGILSAVLEMLKKYFPQETQNNLGIKQNMDANLLVLKTQRFLLDGLRQIIVKHAPPDALIIDDPKTFIEKIYPEITRNEKDFIKLAIEFLADSQYFTRAEETLLESTTNALDEARKESQRKVYTNPIHKDLGQGISEAYWFHNPRNPREWGTSSNTSIMREYMDRLEYALKKHRITLQPETLLCLMCLPFNGAEASQLVTLVMENLTRSNDGTLEEPEIDYKKITRGEPNSIKQILPYILLKHAQDRNWHNLEKFPFTDNYYELCFPSKTKDYKLPEEVTKFLSEKAARTNEEYTDYELNVDSLLWIKDLLLHNRPEEHK